MIGASAKSSCMAPVVLQTLSYNAPLHMLQVARRDWVVKKKKQMRSRGYTNIKQDTKYTGRKRKDRL